MNSRKISIVIIALIITMAVAGGCASTGKNSTETSGVSAPTYDYDVDGEYSVAIPAGNNDSTVMTLIFDKSNMTYKSTVASGELSQDLYSGTYKINESDNIVECVRDSGETEVFNIYGSYLVAADYVYVTSSAQKGSGVPSGETFNATYSYQDKSKGGAVLEFKADGTYKDARTSGTYEIKDGFIKRSASDGSALVDLLITDQGISNSYFKKE